jgi:integrase
VPRKPFFRAFDGWWYAQVTLAGKRKQVKLVKGRENEREAYRAFCRLVADEGQILPATANQSVANVCDLFLDASQRLHKPATFEWHRYYLQDFCDRHGRLMTADLKPFHVTRWLDAHPDWKNSRRHAIGILKRAFNWAEGQGYITANPIRGVKKPRGGKRQRVLTADERRQILEAIPDEPFRQFVFAMQETGCRPGEVAAVTAAQVDLTLGVWTFGDHKTAHQTGKPRVVYLSPAGLALTRTLVERYRTGPLFRGHGGRAYSRNAIRCRFRRLRVKLPDLAHFTAYSYRHTFTTDALTNGVGIAQVAELLGHTGTDMVMRHYQHLAQKVQHMRDAAAKAVGPGETGRPGEP